MSLFDLVLLLIISGFALFGLWFGLVHTLGSLLGSALGVLLATRWYLPLADWLMGITGWSGNFSKVIMFVIAFVLINRLVGLAFFFVDKTLSIVTSLPIISSLNRLLGFVFGIIEGMVVIGIILYFINKYPLSPSLMSSIVSSKVAPYCISVSSILWPLVPEGLKKIEDSLQHVFW